MNAATAAARLNLAEEVSKAATGSGAKEALERLESEYDDLIAALQWFVDNGRTDEALRLASALYRFWITKQRFEDGARWFDLALGAPGGDVRLRARASYLAGFMPFWMGNDPRAAELFSAALKVAREVDDPALVSQALGGLARVAFRADVAEGRRLAGEALAVSEAAGDESARSNALHLLGAGAQIAGDLLDARNWMTKRLALVRTTGNGMLIASEASNLSMVERQLGNLEVAESLARDALEIGEQAGDRFTTPFAISGLAAIATERGAFEHAATLVGAVEAIMAAQQMAWPPDERPHYERMLERLPEALGSEAFERERAAGRAMSVEKAIALAMGD